MDGDGLGNNITEEYCSGDVPQGWVENNGDLNDYLFCESNEIDDCSICDGNFTDAEGGMNGGYIGILPVSFCPTCFNGIMEMAHHFFSLEEK